MDITSTLRDRFSRTFDRDVTNTRIRAVQAPGRVNLIGEHTDYNDGFVLPIAIERRTIAIFAPRDDMIVNLVTLQSDSPASIDITSGISPGKPTWANYCRGVAAGLAEKVSLCGADILFSSDVPIGGGLSSSASLEVATGLALLSASGASIERYELAKICQLAEHDFAGAPCGIMDQAISTLAQAGKAMLLDCRNGDIRHVPFDDPDLVLLVADTKVKHEINDGGYQARREQCYEAAAILKLASLRDAGRSLLDNDKLSPVHMMRARHVVGEIARTMEAVDALEAGDYHAFGKLMYASHASLRDDYEVSCDELDAIVDFAADLKGVYGARMTGGGFGGCAIILVEKTHAKQIASSVADAYKQKFDIVCPIFATAAVAGAGDIEI